MDTTGNKKDAILSMKTIMGAYGQDRVNVIFFPKTEFHPERIGIIATSGPLTFQFPMLPDQAREMASAILEMADHLDALCVIQASAAA